MCPQNINGVGQDQILPAVIRLSSLESAETLFQHNASQTHQPHSPLALSTQTQQGATTISLSAVDRGGLGLETMLQTRALCSSADEATFDSSAS